MPKGGGSARRRGEKVPGSAGGTGATAGAKKFQAWINDPGKVLAWVGKYRIEKMLDQGGGLVKIPHFFPEFVADGILDVLETIPAKHWNVTEAERDLSNNNIAHKFWSSKTAPGLAEIFRTISVLQPGRLNTFSAGKYEKSNHIEPHDDRAYTDVFVNEGKRQVKVQCSRDIAVIYYLTKDWVTSNGGVLIDIPTGHRYVPEYNSLIAFRIPRFHEVTAVTANRARYSVFGWFLTEGILYDLFKGDGSYGSGAGASDSKGGGGGPRKGAKKTANSKPKSTKQSERVVALDRADSAHGEGEREEQNTGFESPGIMARRNKRFVCVSVLM